MMEKEAAYRLIKKFQQLQEERAYTYRIFEEGHKIYLRTGPHYDFVQFRTLVHDVTQDFKRISEEIIIVEKKLRDELGMKNLAEFIGNVQEDEKLKLELTAKLQIARQASQDHSDDTEHQLEVQDLKLQLRNVIERINEHLEEIKYEVDSLL